MGCDIHVMTEAIREIPGIGKIWHNIDHFTINPFYTYREEYAKANGYEVDEDEREWELVPIYSGRNYTLFGVLSDVRNYGGMETLGYDLKGFPKDADIPTKREYDRWGEDAHTPGYCTLKELKEGLAKITAVRHKGFVTKEAQKKYLEEGIAPESWCQGVGGAIRDKFVWMEWEEPISEYDFYKPLIEAIEQRKREYFWIWDPEKDDFSKDDSIRIVFWYDN